MFPQTCMYSSVCNTLKPSNVQYCADRIDIVTVSLYLIIYVRKLYKATNV